MFESTHISTPKSFKFAKPLYLLLTIAGSIAPWFWLLQDPAVLMSPTLFLQLSFANQIATAWASDLLISASVFFIFAMLELKRLGSAAVSMWMLLYVGLTFGIGLSCALPFFMYRREQILERNLVG
jgi:hypothetical protein